MTDRSVARRDLLSDLAATFRRHGYEGASLTMLAEASGLKKASLYHHFPGGKQAMAEAVLDDLAAQFERRMFAPLARPGPGGRRIAEMLAALDSYHQGGTVPGLFAVLAQGPSRERFAARIAAFYGRWIASLAGALAESGVSAEDAVRRAADVVMAIEGALVLARALGDAGPFRRVLRHLAEILDEPVAAA